MVSERKISTGEEFLINKKNPLVVPPEFYKLPLPNTSENLSENDDLSDKNVKEIFEIKDNKEISASEEEITDVEENILEKIN